MILRKKEAYQMQDDNNKNTMHNEDQNHDIGRKIDENFYPEYTAQSPEQAPVQQNAAAGGGRRHPRYRRFPVRRAVRPLFLCEPRHGTTRTSPAGRGPALLTRRPSYTSQPAATAPLSWEQNSTGQSTKR